MKTNFFVFIIILVNSITIGSCKKTNGKYVTQVNGTVRNKITGTPVAGIPVEIIGCSFIGISTKCLEKIGMSVTDAKGYYSMSVESEKWQSYVIAVGNNNILEQSSYPYSIALNTSKNNTVDFSRYPIKILKIRINIQRHDRNWIDIGISNVDQEGYFATDLYNNSNPINDFDSTFNVKILAGRQYQAIITLRDKTAPYTYVNNLGFSKLLTVNNVDTSYVDFVVQ
jgi:hypothetical protein